jgi:integrase
LPLEEPFALTIPRGARKAVRKILQPDDLRLLFSEDTISHYGRKNECFYINAFRLIVILGLRRGELCGLRSEDLKDNILHIQRSINSINEITTGKNENANRYIALPKHAQKILADQKSLLSRNAIVSPWLFPDKEGGQMDSNSLYKYWLYLSQTARHAVQSARIATYHGQRPQIGYAESLLKMMVGHSEAMDTDGVYGHEFSGDLERTARIVDNVYDRILK